MTREEKLQKAHQMFDNRNLLIELKWQRAYFKRGYVSNQEVLFNLWIFDECIKALEQEPCADCISRQAVMDCFKKWQPYMSTRLLDFEQELSSLPSVYPQEPKTDTLDKIRAEIMSKDGLEEALEIIDKYKDKAKYNNTLISERR